MPDLDEMTTEELRSHVAAELTRTRQRSALLTEAVDEHDLVRQHSPLMSPLVWDLAHIGSQEEIWLVRDVGGVEPLRPDIDDLYDAFQHPRAERPQLPLLGPAEARDYVGEVRDKALDVLQRNPLRGRRLVDGGGCGPARPDIDALSDACRHPRAERPQLPRLGPAEARDYVGEVRDKALDVLQRNPLRGRRLVESAFAFGMIAQHEQQHDE